LYGTFAGGGPIGAPLAYGSNIGGGATVPGAGGGASDGAGMPGVDPNGVGEVVRGAVVGEENVGGGAE
jgi:hypothetical protein